MLLLFIRLSVEMDLIIKSVHGTNWENASGSDLNSEVSENGQNKYLILLIFVASFFLSFLYCICVRMPLQGTSHITCMPGTVRRWNYPPPLCIGKNKSSVLQQQWSKLLILNRTSAMVSGWKLCFHPRKWGFGTQCSFYTHFSRIKVGFSSRSWGLSSSGPYLPPCFFVPAHDVFRSLLLHPYGVC